MKGVCCVYRKDYTVNDYIGIYPLPYGVDVRVLPY